MPDKKHRNPFEDHINSDSFDVSNLGEGSRVAEMGVEISDFLKRLPQPLTHELWDTELDEQQKAISAYLVTELAERIIRELHTDEVAQYSHHELIFLLTVPVTLAMLAEQQLHTPAKPEQPVQPIIAHPTAYPSQTTPIIAQANFAAIREIAMRWFQRVKERVMLFLSGEE